MNLEDNERDSTASATSKNVGSGLLAVFLAKRSQCSGSQPNKHPINITVVKRMDFSQNYSRGSQVGEGAYGVVRACTEILTGDTFACKTISRRKLYSTLDMQNLMTEVGAMEAMAGHPSIIEFKECFKDDESVHLVMEMCTGGDLFTRIKRLRQYSERDAAIVCSKLASALEFAHSHGIMHRDIKPENILLASPDSNTDIRLADFGSAAFFKPNQKLNEFVGSSLYMAPCVLRYSYGPEADLWSVGIVLYILLCGEPPFSGTTNAEIMKNVLHAPLPLSGRRWNYVSESGKDLVRKLLTRDDQQRLTAKQVQNHPWIRYHNRKVAAKAPVMTLASQHELLQKRRVAALKYSNVLLHQDASSHPSLGREIALEMMQRNVFQRNQNVLQRRVSGPSNSDPSSQLASADESSSELEFSIEEDIPTAMPI